jgi:penicillin-binding protein 1A
VERHPAYLAATRAWLEARLKPDVLYGSGLKVTTGIDLVFQEETERLFEAKTHFLEDTLGKKAAPLQSAAVLLDVETGRIRAVWGGFGETATGFNRATQAKRQPGSSFKPVVYALAVSGSFSAASTVPNLRRVFKTPQGDWSPRNVTGDYTPTAALAYGIAWSQNVATANLLEQLGGPAPLIGFAKKLGFDTSRFTAEMGLALGQGEVTPLEMAQLSATVANGGVRVAGTPVLLAVDAAGTERIGAPRSLERVLTPETAALTRDLMRLVVDAGTGGAVRGTGNGEAGYLGQVMGKTGTTDMEKDAWFIGATPHWAGAVWVGYDQPVPLGGSAADLAAPLWGWWIGRLARHEAPLPTFPVTPKIVHRRICSFTGKLAGPACPSLDAPFLPGTEPKLTCAEEHPPSPEEGEDGKPKWEGLWQKLAREKAEREAAQQSEGAAEP